MLQSKMPENKIKQIIIVLSSLFLLVGMGVDLIAPALPALTQQLNISGTIAKNLIVFYLLGYAIGNFSIGFLSDSYGRRTLILSGCGLFIIASILPIFFTHSILLLTARFLQGFAVATFMIPSRAVLADILPQHRLVKTATLVPPCGDWGL